MGYSTCEKNSKNGKISLSQKKKKTIPVDREIDQFSRNKVPILLFFSHVGVPQMCFFQYKRVWEIMH